MNDIVREEDLSGAATGEAVVAPVTSRAKFYTIMAALLLVEILGSLESSMITSVIPAVVREFLSLIHI